MSKQEPFVLEFEADVGHIGEPGEKDRWRIVVKGTTIQVEHWESPDAMGTKHWESFRGDGWSDAAILRYAVTALVRGVEGAREVAARSFVDTSTETTEAYVDAMATTGFDAPTGPADPPAITWGPDSPPTKQALFARAFALGLAGHRAGQALFNATAELMPDLAEEIRQTPNDPFHASGPDDPRLAGALELIERRIKDGGS